MDQDIREDRIKISPINLGDGGSPNLAADIMSHHNALRGRMVFSPRVIASVRVPLRS